MTPRAAQASMRWISLSAGTFAAVAVGVWLVLRITSPIVTVTDAVEGPVVQAFYSTGTIQPEREYPIRSAVAGTISEVRVDKGSAVKKGDLLAIVTDPALKFQVDKAQAELTEKLARLDPKTSPVLQEFDAKITAYGDLVDIAKREVARMQGFVEHSAGAQGDLDIALDRLKKNWSDLEGFKTQRASKLLELQKDVDVARAALATAQSNFDQQSLTSPIDGVVLDRPTALRTRVAINDKLMNVANVTHASLVMRAAVDEEDIAKVRRDQVVRMTLYSFPDRSFEGKVQKIYDQADPERRTFEVEVQILDKTEKLSPGMTGELAFIMDSRDRAVVIPSQALQKGAVYTVKNGRLSRNQIDIGLRGVERTEVRSGIKPGDKVVISIIGDNKDTQRVRTTYVDPLSAANMNKPKPKTDNFKGFQ